MRQVTIHAVLLVAALAFAYQTWTRDDRPLLVPESVIVWRGELEDVQRVTFEAPDQRLVLEPRTDEVGTYVWGTATFTRPATDSTAAQADSVVQFVGDAQATALLEALASPLATRDLGAVDEQQKEELGLTASRERVTVESGGQTRELRVGGIVYASGDRYVETMGDGRVYVFEARTLNGLENGGTILFERRVVHTPPQDIAQVTLVTPSSSRTRTRVTAPDGSDAWTPDDAPERPDQAFGTFMQRIGQLTIMSYHPEVALPSLEELARLEYRNGRGELLEEVRLLRAAGDAPAYYVSSKYTRVPARVFASGAERLAEDLAQVF